MEIVNNRDVDQQVGEVDLLDDEFEDEITKGEAHLRQLRVTRITLSTIVQLTRHVAPTDTVENVAQGAELVIGGEGGPLTGPLAYAAFTRLKLVDGQVGRPAAVPNLQPPRHPLVEAFG